MFDLVCEGKSFLKIGFRHLVVGSLTREEAHHFPGMRRQSKEGIHSGHIDTHRRTAIHNVFPVHNLGMQARTTLRDQSRRDLRQCNIERTREIHGRFSMLRIALMPGRK